MLLARRDSLLKDCSSKLRPKDLPNLCTDHFDQQEVFNSDILFQVEDNMIKRLSIIKESDTKSYTGILPEILISGGHITQKLLRKVTSLFVIKEHSQTPLMEITLRMYHEVAGDEKGNDFPGERLQDF